MGWKVKSSRTLCLQLPDVLEVLENNLLGYHDTEGWEIITGNSERMVEIVEEFLYKNLFKFYRTSDNYGRIILAE